MTSTHLDTDFLDLLSLQSRFEENANIPAFPALTIGEKNKLEQEALCLRNPYGCYVLALLNPIRRNLPSLLGGGGKCLHKEIHRGICLECAEFIDVIREAFEVKNRGTRKEASSESDPPSNSVDSEDETYLEIMDKNVLKAFMDTNVPEYIREGGIKICQSFPRERTFGLRGANKDRLVFACIFYAYSEFNNTIDPILLGDSIFRDPITGEPTFKDTGKIRYLDKKQIEKALKQFSEGQIGFRPKTIFISAFDHIMNFFSTVPAKNVLPQNIFDAYFVNEIRKLCITILSNEALTDNDAHTRAMKNFALRSGQEKKMAGLILFYFLEKNGFPIEMRISQISLAISNFFEIKETFWRSVRKKIEQHYNLVQYSGASAANPYSVIEISSNVDV